MDTGIRFSRHHGNYKAQRIPAAFSTGGSGQITEVKTFRLPWRQTPFISLAIFFRDKPYTTAVPPPFARPILTSGQASPGRRKAAASPPAHPGPHRLGEWLRRGARAPPPRRDKSPPAGGPGAAGCRRQAGGEPGGGGVRAEMRPLRPPRRPREP